MILFYTDQELDKESGLYNYDARLYDPIVGRFISADSVVSDLYDPQSLNRYAYCVNNPLIYTDPSGHSIGPDSTDPMSELEDTLSDAQSSLGDQLGGDSKQDSSRDYDADWDLNYADEYGGSIVVAGSRYKPHDIRGPLKDILEGGWGYVGPSYTIRSKLRSIPQKVRAKAPVPTTKSSPFGPKVADPVPKSGVPKNWSKDQIRDAISDYKASIASRKAELKAFDAAKRGSATQRKAHAQRITREESFLGSLEKALGSRP